MIYIFIAALLFAAFITWELYRAPLMEDENDKFIYDDDPTTTCWDNDHHPDQSV